MASTSSFQDKVKPKKWNIMGKMTLLTLDLRYKNLKQLPDELFELEDLEALDLSGNTMIELSNGLSRLTNLKLLNLNDCNLKKVPAVVMKLPQLQKLILSNNENITLPDEMSSLVNLKVLHLYGCNLVTLPPIVLKLLPQIKVQLDNREQISLTDAQLHKLTNIKSLRLRYSKQGTVPPALQVLLEDLNLSWNRRPVLLQLDELSGRTNFRTSNLWKIDLVTVPPVVWRLTQLEELDLSYNPLQTLSAEVGQLTNVKHLDLSRCQLRELPTEVFRLRRLEWLDLNSNPLQTLPAEVGQLTNIKYLDLSYCKLRKVPAEVWRLTRLEWLDLRSSPLQTLPFEFGNLTNITHLNLPYCQLRTLPPEVGRLSQLEWLNLSSNPLQTLPAEVGQLTNVKHLNLSCCELRTLPPEVGRLTQLEWLNLSFNRLQTLPAEIGHLTNVKYLNLSDCQLRTLPHEVGRLTQIQTLDLSNNQLQMLPAEVGRINYLIHLHVRKNPLIKPPAEVCRQGITAIRHYFDELERSEEKVSASLKVVVIGEKMAGKTSLLQTLQKGESSLTEEEDRTHCVEITQWAPDDNITFEVYDFGGHDVYHLTHQFFLTQNALNLLTVNLETYSCTEESYKEAVGFWLDTLNARVPGAVVTIVGSKKDRCNDMEREDKTRDIRQRFKQQHDIWQCTLQRQIQTLENAKAVEGKTYHAEVRHQLERTRQLLTRPLRLTGLCCVSSAEPTSGLDTLKTHILDTANNTALFPIVRRILPRTWVDFEQQLRKLRVEGTATHDTPKWLARADCLQQGQLAGLTADRLEPVLSYLQQMGTILRYTDIPELKDLVFHDPPALIELFKDLFHHHTKELFTTPGLQYANYTRAQLDDFEQDLRDCGLIRKDVLTCMLSSNVAPDIVTALMQHFGICFELRAEGKTDPSKQNVLYKIPWYLYKQMPEELKDVWPKDVPEEQEQLQLMCDIRGFCPRGLFQRFSVGIHPLVKDRVDWKDGIMAYRQDYPVLVCSKPAADDTYITMTTRGRPDQAGEMWGVVHPLLEVLVQLLQEWPGVLYSLHVTCAHCIKARLDNPHQYDLRDRTADDGRDVRCPKVKKTAATSSDLVYRPGRFSGRNRHVIERQSSYSLGPEVSVSPEEQTQSQRQTQPHGKPQPKDELVLLKRLLTEAKVKDDAHEAHYNSLAAHVSELGLTFRVEVPGDGNCMFHAVSDQVIRTEGRHIHHLQLRQLAVDHLKRNPRNARGDHLSDFTSNQTWEEYLQTMSRDGTWGDHVVLQAMADMLGRDVIIVSSVEADNYVIVLQPQSGANPETARPLMLGHYAENHYASLDETPAGGKPVVLLVIDEVGTSKGGISTINGQLLDLLTARAKVLCTVLHATEEEKRKARSKGIDLVLPMANTAGESRPTLDWLNLHQKQRYPILRSDVSVIVGHADVTSTAARNIKKDRLPSAKFILYNHVMPEDTEHHKSGDKAMGIGDKMEAIREDTEEADAVFSVGPTMHDYYKTQIKLSRPHHIFLPKPSDIFSRMEVTYVETETKVVLTVGRVKGVEKLKGYDLLAKAMVKVLDRFSKARWRARGVSKEDFPDSKEIIQANIEKGRVHFTPLKYGTQEQLSGDFKEAHVVLMPSRAEPFGLVGLEAIAAGVPVLVSSNSGLAEFLERKGPEFDRPIVDMEGSDDVVAERLAKRIIKVLKGGPAEFEAAKRLKDKLMASKYWEESHRKFLEECGIPQ